MPPLARMFQRRVGCLLVLVVGLFLLSVLWGLDHTTGPAGIGQRSLGLISDSDRERTGVARTQGTAQNVAPALVAHAALLASHRRCGELPWLGVAATTEACLARVLEQPATACSHTHFIYADLGDRNCACATPGSHCDPSDDRATRTAAVSSLYRISAPELTPSVLAPGPHNHRSPGPIVDNPDATAATAAAAAAAPTANPTVSPSIEAAMRDRCELQSPGRVEGVTLIYTTLYGTPVKDQEATAIAIAKGDVAAADHPRRHFCQCKKAFGSVSPGSASIDYSPWKIAQDWWVYPMNCTEGCGCVPRTNPPTASPTVRPVCKRPFAPTLPPTAPAFDRLLEGILANKCYVGETALLQSQCCGVIRIATENGQLNVKYLSLPRVRFPIRKLPPSPTHLPDRARSLHVILTIASPGRRVSCDLRARTHDAGAIASPIPFVPDAIATLPRR